MLNKLTKIANELEAIGLFQYACTVDKVIVDYQVKYAAITEVNEESTVEGWDAVKVKQMLDAYNANIVKVESMLNNQDDSKNQEWLKTKADQYYVKLDSPKDFQGFLDILTRRKDMYNQRWNSFDEQTKQKAEQQPSLVSAPTAFQSGWGAMEEGVNKGQLTVDQTVPLASAPGFRLSPDMAEKFEGLHSDWLSRTGNKLVLRDAWRSYASQVGEKIKWTNRGDPEAAATPGESRHGAGAAIDINLVASGITSQAKKDYFTTIAASHGFHPLIRSYTGTESWHYSDDGH